jgi:mRNA-degrading endonuclease RelE of RelBE toxin-antitoxin system
MTKTIKYHETDAFKKDFKKLSKKFKTLAEDINVAKRNTIELFHLSNIDNHGIELIPGFNHDSFQIYKLRKFACKALKGKGVKSGIRIIYAYHAKNNQVIFLEIYFKADQENEDKDRIESFLKSV